MGDQRSAVQQAGEIIVLSEVADLPFGDDAGLHLSEECGDCLQRVQLLRQPFPVSELDEAQDAGGDVTGQQRHAGERAGGDARALLDILLIVGVCRLGAQDIGLFHCFGPREYRVGIGEIHHTDRVRVRNVRAWRP